MNAGQPAYSLIPRIFLSLNSWKTPVLISGALEAGFYGMLKSGSIDVEDTSNFKKVTLLYRWMRETCVFHINTIQILFNAANFGITTFYTKKIVDCCFKALDKENSHWGWKIIAGIGIFGSTFALAYKCSPRLHPHFFASDKETGEQVPIVVSQLPIGSLSPMKIREAISHQQQIATHLHAMKIVLDLAWACFDKHRFILPAFTLAQSAYCLWRDSQLKWVSFARNTTFPGKQYTTTFHMLALPQAGQSECLICSSELEKPITFCVSHVYCQPCTERLVTDKSKLLSIQTKKQKFEVIKDGRHEGYKFKASIEPELLPYCEHCKGRTKQNWCDLKVIDKDGIFTAPVTINWPSVDRQYLFENLYAIYNVAQSILAYLQTYPEIKGTIFQIQKVLIITDLIGLGATYYYLWEKISKKYNKEESIGLMIDAAALPIASVAISYFAVSKLNNLAKSASLLKELLHQLPISPEILKTLEVSWNSPVSHKLIQSLYINRIIGMVALTFFTEQRKTNLLSVACQLFNFMGISKLPWLEFKQTWERPLKMVWSRGGSFSSAFSNVDSVKSLQLSTYFITNRSDDLKSTLWSIYEYSDRVFDRSHWHKYWRTTNNTLRLIYAIELQSLSFVSLPGSFFPQFVEHSIKVIDTLWGTVVPKTRYN